MDAVLDILTNSIEPGLILTCVFSMLGLFVSSFACFLIYKCYFRFVRPLEIKAELKRFGKMSCPYEK